MCLSRGDFVRVRESSDFRPGQDGVVFEAPDADGFVGMIFGYDRHNEPLPTASVGVEAWHIDELDLSSVEH